MKKSMTFHINGRDCTAEVDPSMRLLDLLRETFSLTGTKEGCAEGECGACTVVVDGDAVASCLVLAGQVEGADIVTIEGLSDKNELHRLQQAFIDAGAVQCGFCTPGMILSAYALLNRNPNPTEDEIRVAISGNLCRCTGYQKIVQAIEIAVGKEGVG